MICARSIPFMTRTSSTLKTWETWRKCSRALIRPKDRSISSTNMKTLAMSSNLNRSWKTRFSKGLTISKDRRRLMTRTSLSTTNRLRAKLRWMNPRLIMTSLISCHFLTNLLRKRSHLTTVFSTWNHPWFLPTASSLLKMPPAKRTSNTKMIPAWLTSRKPC